MPILAWYELWCIAPLARDANGQRCANICRCPENYSDIAVPPTCPAPGCEDFCLCRWHDLGSSGNPSSASSEDSSIESGENPNAGGGEHSSQRSSQTQIRVEMTGKVECKPPDAGDESGRRCDSLCRCPEYSGGDIVMALCPAESTICTKWCRCEYHANIGPTPSQPCR